MYNFAPKDIIQGALDSSHPLLKLYLIVTEKIKASNPDVTEAELGKIGVYFMSGASAAFALFMEATERPEEEAVQLIQKISDDLQFVCELARKHMPSSI